MPEIILAYYAGSAEPTPPHQRTLKPEILKHGYNWPFVNLFVPAYGRGIRTFLYHLPAGRQQGGPESHMDFDGFVEIRRAIEADAIAYNLHPTQYTHAARQFLTTCPDAELWTYLGSLRWDEDMRLAKTTPAKWIHRALESLEPVLQIGTHRNAICFDEIVGGVRRAGLPDLPANRQVNVPDGSAEHRLLQLIQSLGYRVLIEPIPWASPNMEHLWPFDSITMEQHWKSGWQLTASKHLAQSPAAGRQYVMEHKNADTVGKLLVNPRVAGVIVPATLLDAALRIVSARNN